MSWIELAITAGGYLASALVYWVNNKKAIFTQEQLKEMREGLDALGQGLKSINKDSKP